MNQVRDLVFPCSMFEVITRERLMVVLVFFMYCMQQQNNTLHLALQEVEMNKLAIGSCIVAAEKLSVQQQQFQRKEGRNLQLFSPTWSSTIKTLPSPLDSTNQVCCTIRWMSYKKQRNILTRFSFLKIVEIMDGCMIVFRAY